ERRGWSPKAPLPANLAWTTCWRSLSPLARVNSIAHSFTKAELDMLYSSFLVIIWKGDESLYKHRADQPKRQQPDWWNDVCMDMLLARNSAWRERRRNPTPDTAAGCELGLRHKLECEVNGPGAFPLAVERAATRDFFMMNNDVTCLAGGVTATIAGVIQSDWLAILENVDGCLRRVHGQLSREETFQERATVVEREQNPAQANAATLMDRVGRWTLCSCQGTSDCLGGAAADDLLAKIPMKVVINCLVRMAHASSTSLFRQRLEAGIASLVKSAQRIPAFSLPQTTRDAVARNAKKLKLFGTILTEEERDLILSMLNADWAETTADEGLVHVCTADCCASDEDFERRMTAALRAAFGGRFEVPLLYRWKGFEPAAEFAARGVGIHGLFLSLWRFCRSDAGDIALEDATVLDEDAPDSNPAFKQQIRMSKVQQILADSGAGKTAIAEYLQLLESPATADNWFADLGVSKHVLLAWVLADGVSETVRRKRMQRLKIMLEDVVVSIPSTSVQVERQHANIQLDSAANKKTPQRAGGVQANSYVTTTLLAHRKVRSCLESEKFGVAKARIRRTMKSRCASTSFFGLPKKGKAKITPEGTVKGRNGLLKGLLSGPHSVPLCRSVREGKVRKDATAKTRRVSAYNVFQQECRYLVRMMNSVQISDQNEIGSMIGSRCDSVKVGSLEHRQFTQMLSAEWARMTPQRKQEYQLRANDIQLERDRLRSQALQHQNSAAEAAATGTGLRESQIKRLNGARLDSTLQQVSAHKCWQQELGIWDHNAALRGSLVKIPADRAGMDALRAEYDKLFGYDAQVLGNPTSTPTFLRACATTEAGTCVKDEHHDQFVALVGQFDAGLGKLGGSPLLIKFEVRIYNDLVLDDDVDSVLELPSCLVAEFGIGFKEADDAAAARRATSSTAVSKLPFGMSALVEPKRRLRKPQQTADDDQECDKAESSVKKRKLQPSADPEEAWPTVLSPEAQEELDRALAADLAAQRDDLEEQQPADALVSVPASSSDAPASAVGLPACSSDTPASAAGLSESQSSYFQKQLGICELAIVKRKGVKCFHCEDHIDKGEYRFGLAYSKSKPHRSIHMHCLAQLREEFVSNSIGFLEQRVTSGRLPRVEHDICQDALRTLRDLQPDP
ncbi:hypothetical protein AK812_SmicGene42563, partial [Symbiodinium microadriaticum]